MPEVTDHTALLSGSYWTGLDTTFAALPTRPVFVTYSFPTTAPVSHADPGAMGTAVSTFQALNPAQQTQARQALAEWANACGITLIEVAPGQGQINFATYDFSGTVWDGAGGIAFYPFGDWHNGTAPYYFDQAPYDGSGDVFLNRDFFSGGLPDYGTLLHEIGHALGLKHPWEVLGNGHDETLRSDLDTALNTIMSSNGVSNTLGPLDIAAMQAIYGTNAQDGTQVASWSWNAVSQRLTQTGFATADVIIGISVADTANGGRGNDAIFGLNGNDILKGAAGNDTIYGGAGNDQLFGGAGADLLDGNSGADTASFAQSTGVTVSLDGSLAATGEAIGDVLADIENLTGSLTGADTLRGNAANNVLSGQGGNDELQGQAGNDKLQGGLGADTLTGGAGADRFYFATPGEGGDTIIDFDIVRDRIEAKGSAFGGLAPSLTLNPANFVAGTAANAAVAQFIYAQGSGTLLFDGDGTGVNAAILIATLTTGANLAADDIRIV
jgi:Ca2+-binding RTX toxin-like protein